MRNQRLIAVFFLGWLAFNYPLFALFDRDATLVGVPVLYVYVFAAWALLIALMAAIVRKAR